MNKDEIIRRLEALKTELMARYKVKGVELFGSFARKDQGTNSDIDILLDFEDGADLFDFVGVGDFLEADLKRKVDVVPKNALRKEIRETVLKEAVRV
ncbi:nucleotidyltransferase family protein [Fibrobacterota bacterium]